MHPNFWIIICAAVTIGSGVIINNKKYSVYSYNNTRTCNSSNLHIKKYSYLTAQIKTALLSVWSLLVAPLEECRSKISCFE